MATSAGKRTGGGDTGDEAKVLTFHHGNSTTIMLNRPKALNALDAEMIELIDQAIETSAPHTSIVLRGKGRALCSGGDVMAVVTQANSKDPKVRQQALAFFKEEFELDYRIATLNKGSKPRTYISIMDGITMGGGVGLSVHAPIRIASEKTLFAMPETGIGYWPDVGVTRHLSRLDGRVGQYLGMTGARISGEEAYLTGLASHFISSSVIDNAVRRIQDLAPNANAKTIAETLEEFSVDPFDPSSNSKGLEIAEKTPFLGSRRIALDYVFSRSSASAVRSALEEITNADPGSQTWKALAKQGIEQNDERVVAWAQETIKTMDTKSPRSLQVALTAINATRHMNEEDAFRFDMRVATAFCDLSIGRDFYEGVTHTLTKHPKTGKRREGVADWDPKNLKDLNLDRIETLFFGPVEQAKEAGMRVDMPLLDRVPDQAEQAQPKAIGHSMWEPAHNSFALPSEAECDALRESSHPASGDYQLQGDEMIEILQNIKSDKPSIAFKVKDWLARRRQMGMDRE